MGKVLVVLALVFGTLVGCQTTQPASMDPLPNWEYKYLKLGVGADNIGRNPEAILKQYNGLGAQGWEFVDIHDTLVLFRRPKRK